jgi:hypothetical protein
MHCEYMICSILGLLRPILWLGTLRRVSLSYAGPSMKGMLGVSSIMNDLEFLEFFELPDLRLVCWPLLDS